MVYMVWDLSITSRSLFFLLYFHIFYFSPKPLFLLFFKIFWFYFHLFLFFLFSPSPFLSLGNLVLAFYSPSLEEIPLSFASGERMGISFDRPRFKSFDKHKFSNFFESLKFGHTKCSWYFSHKIWIKRTYHTKIHPKITTLTIKTKIAN